MIFELKAIYDTIERFENKKLFKTDTMYLPYKTREILNFYPKHKFPHYRYIIYSFELDRSNTILFLGQNIHYREEILTNEEFIIKNIIE